MPTDRTLALYRALPEALRARLTQVEGPGWVVCWYVEDKRWTTVPVTP
jgi:hypothetical protein